MAVPANAHRVNSLSISVIENPHVLGPADYPDRHLSTLSPQAAQAARARIEAWPNYAPTPLRSLPTLASGLGVQQVLYKDEGDRFGLGSFKALGGAYAIQRLLEQRVRDSGAEFDLRTLLEGGYESIAHEVTVCSATDGNHGKSVAWGAQMCGCRAVIYIHETVSEARAEAIAQYGAEVIRNPGNYDAAVRRAAEDAERHQWTVVSDTSWPGYQEIPSDVMHGYTVMASEAIEQYNSPISHVFLQGGVGGLAAAVCAVLWWHYGKARPTSVIVEPATAACLFASAARGEATTVKGDLETIMAGLSCGEPSLTAWPVLRDACAWFTAIDDEDAAHAMRRLAAGDGDAPVVAGESAAAGIAGLLCVANDPSKREQLGLRSDSTILVFGTEGATDPQMYRKLVGRSPDEVNR